MRGLLGSIAVHAVLGALMIVVGSTEGVPHGTSAQPITIEVIELPAESRPSTPLSTTPGGGASGAAASSEARDLPRAPTSARSRSGAVRSARTAEPDPRGEVTFERDDASGTASGDATGASGSGAGRGIGFGDGGGITRVDPPDPPPPPRGDPPSKARPAKLIYPSRERDVDDAELFIARVIIDTDGYVAGARIVRGFGGPRDEMAAELIWNFRYAPALDDDGHPIRSTLDQRFLVGR